MVAKRVLLDTDPGIDDSLAILLTLASPELQLEAVTVTGGNCVLEQGVVNALSVLELAGASHLPVAAGGGVPLINLVNLAIIDSNFDLYFRQEIESLFKKRNKSTPSLLFYPILTKIHCSGYNDIQTILDSPITDDPEH